MIYVRGYGDRTNLKLWIQQIYSDDEGFEPFLHLAHPDSKIAHISDHCAKLMKTHHTTWKNINCLEKCLKDQIYKHHIYKL